MHHSPSSLCAVLVIVATTLCSSLIAVEPPPSRLPAHEAKHEQKTDSAADAAVLNIKTRRQVKVDGTQDEYKVVENSDD